MNEKIMMTKNTGGEYAPVFTGATLEDPPMIEAVEIDGPSSLAEYVEVQAPASLGPGYELTVNLDGDHWVVLVPDGGVQEGEHFRAKVLRKASSGLAAGATSGSTTNKKNDNPHSVPVGGWRDGCCDCCALGCCHPHFCCACWCGPCALGQVMTRMNLSPFADPYVRGTTRTWTTCGIMGLAATLVVFTTYIITLAIIPYPYPNKDGVVHADPGDKFWNLVKTLIALSWAAYFFLATCKTRAYIRRTYGIPETRCRGCEDCCCSYWCGCCTVAQMARHTADYRTFRSACYNSTGLAASAPPTLPVHLV